nr:immunoglobulin heavy chain junction region [Macaca mulatta]MOW75118.1 immunoglobulin heavy chain junction region [Macaca mulatta]MOW75146.1 immunoglobulin heavy chain junction region [Macaca mulatta]MOW75164.1 immunoglobulin heavy chain junction region [Macaca mulatta]MOW75193.1 immunoglobulin heavy chain junction region [Macaca mulatta]
CARDEGNRSETYYGLDSW